MWRNSGIRRALHDWQTSVAVRVQSAFARGELMPEARGVPNGRETLPGAAQVYQALYRWLPKVYRGMHLQDLENFKNLPAEQLLEILAHTHPDISAALFQIVTFAATPYSVVAHKVEQENGLDAEDADATAKVRALLHRLNQPQPHAGYQEGRYIESLCAMLDASNYIHGACGLETVAANSPVWEVQSLTPFSVKYIWFRLNLKENRWIPWEWVRYPVYKDGEVWEGEYKQLDYPTIFYETVQKLPDDPNGISPILSTLRVVFFHLDVLRDLQAWIHSHGYQRVKVTLLEEVYTKRAPAQVRGDAAKLSAWLTSKMQETVNLYNQLNPDDAIVHWDSQQPSYMGSSGGTQGTIDVEKIMRVIDHQLSAALKIPLSLLGRHEGSTESYHSTDITIHIQGVEMLRAPTDRIISRALTMAMAIEGVRCRVKFERQPIDLRDPGTKLKDEASHTATLQSSMKLGLIDPQEVAARLGYPPVPDDAAEMIREAVRKSLENGFAQSRPGGADQTPNDR